MTETNESASTFPKRYEFTVHSYGCKVNTYDSGLLQQKFRNSGYRELEASEASTVPRVHILNTCAVTSEASREAARHVRRLKAKDPLSTVVVTGCAAQVDGEIFDNLPGADLIIANSHKGQIENLLDRYFKGTLESHVVRSNIFLKADLEEGGGVESHHTRAFLKVQDGCNSFCSYCVIPFARGRSRSISIKDLVRRIDELVATGTREVVLTGVHIADYEDSSVDGPKHLVDLVRAVLSGTKLARLRLSSLEVGELTSEILELYGDSRLCPHFHLSVQAIDNDILRLMKRRYSAEEVFARLELIKTKFPKAFVGMDMITGFPGETEEKFLSCYRKLSELPWSKLHVFPYSERPGTKAVALGRDKDSDVHPIAVEVRKKRAQRLRELSQERFISLARAQNGDVKQGLVLKMLPDGKCEALSRDYWTLKVDCSLLTHEQMHQIGNRKGELVTVVESDGHEREFTGVLRARATGVLS